MRKDGTFASERLTFRGICEEDTEYLVKWRSDPETIRYFRNPTPVTKESHLRWLREVYYKNQGRYDFVIFEKNEGVPIGTVGVNRLEPGSDTCEISYMIAESAYQRKGYGVEAISAMMDYIKKRGATHFIAEVHMENQASIATIRKIGYTILEEAVPFVLYHKQEDKHVVYSR